MHLCLIAATFRVASPDITVSHYRHHGSTYLSADIATRRVEIQPTLNTNYCLRVPRQGSAFDGDAPYAPTMPLIEV